MKLSTKAFLPLFLISSSLLFIAPAYSLDAMQQIPMSRALGQSGDLPVVAVPMGHGVNLSFLKTGHQIQTVWLDDPSRVVLSFDTPLCEADGQSGGRCGGASIIRIRQMEDPLPFPDNATLSYGGGGGVVNTLMTVIATSGNQRHLYQFTLRLTPSSTSSASTFEVVPDSPSRPQTQVSQRPQVLLTVDRDRLSRIRQGLSYAQSQNMMDTASSEWSKLQSFLSLAASGQYSIEESMQQSGVSPVLIDRLVELSGQQS